MNTTKKDKKSNTKVVNFGKYKKDRESKDYYFHNKHYNKYPSSEETDYVLLNVQPDELTDNIDWKTLGSIFILYVMSFAIIGFIVGAFLL